MSSKDPETAGAGGGGGGASGDSDSEPLSLQMGTQKLSKGQWLAWDYPAGTIKFRPELKVFSVLSLCMCVSPFFLLFHPRVSLLPTSLAPLLKGAPFSELTRQVPPWALEEVRQGLWPASGIAAPLLALAWGLRKERAESGV